MNRKIMPSGIKLHEYLKSKGLLTNLGRLPESGVKIVEVLLNIGYLQIVSYCGFNICIRNNCNNNKTSARTADHKRGTTICRFFGRMIVCSIF